MTEKGLLFNIQHFSVHDGPGIRTTVFFKGCNLHCWWCHNPESWSGQPQLQFFPSKCIGCGECSKLCPNSPDGKTALFTKDCTACGVCADNCYAGARVVTGREYTAEQVMEEIKKDSDAYTRSGGGVTFSGGEPLLQPQFLLSLLTECQKCGIHTAVETACCVPWETVSMLLPYLDLVFVDIKTMDSEKHREATGQSNSLILDNIMRMSGTGVSLQLRTPVIPAFNNDEDSIRAIAQFVASLPARHTLELLPFHGICVGKYESLGRSYAAAGLKTPAAEQLQRLKAIAAEAGVEVK